MVALTSSEWTPLFRAALESETNPKNYQVMVPMSLERLLSLVTSKRIFPFHTMATSLVEYDRQISAYTSEERFHDAFSRCSWNAAFRAAKLHVNDLAVAHYLWDQLSEGINHYRRYLKVPLTERFLLDMSGMGQPNQELESDLISKLRSWYSPEVINSCILRGRYRGGAVVGMGGRFLDHRNFRLEGRHGEITVSLEKPIRGDLIRGIYPTTRTADLFIRQHLGMPREGYPPDRKS